MRSLILTALFALACVAHAQDAVQLETIAVTGTQPGPGLWKVSKDDHVLWILGTLSPLPRDIHFESKELDEKIAAAQQVLTGAQVEVKADTGFFGKLALLPSLISVRDNPDGAQLRDVVPPELYARWQVLKQKYLGHNNQVEHWRPIFAALKLYEAALDRNRLTGEDYVRRSVLDAARHAHATVTTPTWNYTLAQPREAIKQFKTASVDDIDCFRKTLDRIDADLATMTARANAWATGDIAALRALPQSDQMAACVAALEQSSIARDRGMDDVDARVAQVWLDAARGALEHNATTVAVLPMRHLLDDNGYLARLKALGYTVEAPDGDIEATDAVSAN